ncbi:uncharacterized protein LOC144567128 [Carex rostrata]
MDLHLTAVASSALSLPVPLASRKKQIRSHARSLPPSLPSLSQSRKKIHFRFFQSTERTASSPPNCLASPLLSSSAQQNSPSRLFLLTTLSDQWTNHSHHLHNDELICLTVQFLTEKQKVASVAPSKKSDEGATQKETEAIQRETSPIETGNKQVDDTFTPSRRSDRVVTQNSTRGNERETLATKPGAKQVDGDFTPSKKSDKGANQAETSPAKKGARQADGTCTSASKNGIAGVRRNHICEENQQSPTKSCGNHERKQVRSKENGKGTLRNANDASTSHANNTNVKMNNRFSHVPVHKFMDRNSSAHTFEWNDSIDDAPKMENAQTVMQSKRTQQIQNQKGQIPKRRRVVRWQPHEEEALRKAVKEIGKGNWKEILDTYPDEFTGRTAVNLKDKWRNMAHY